MKLIAYLEKNQDLGFHQNNTDELILSPKALSRLGKLTFEDCLKAAKDFDGRSILEWDLLMTQDQFTNCVKKLEHLDLSSFHAIRVQDPGALHYIKNQFPKLKIQLILENGNHNIVGVKKWIELSGEQLERVILSNELPKEKLKDFIQEIDKPVEIMGLGRILLFYTPRNLLSALYSDHDDNLTQKVNPYYEGLCHSQESAHNGFPVVDNEHGTFMFNTKNLFLLEYLDELVEIGIQHLRIDLRGCGELTLLNDIKKLMQGFSRGYALSIKGNYPYKTIRGFFHTNKTNILFKKLKNQRIQRNDGSYLGDVIEVRKKEYMGIMLRNKNHSLVLGQNILIKTPDGKEKITTIEQIKNSSLDSLESANSGQIVFLKHVNGVSVKSAIYLN